jgi:hypothetical protein
VVRLTVVVSAARVAMFDVIRNGDNTAVVITAVISSADVKQLLLSLLRCSIISLPSTNTMDKRISLIEKVKEKQSKARLAI